MTLTSCSCVVTMPSLMKRPYSSKNLAYFSGSFLLWSSRKRMTLCCNTSRNFLGEGTGPEEELRPRRKRSHLGRISVALVWISTFLLYSATLEPISRLTSNMLGFCTWGHWSTSSQMRLPRDPHHVGDVEDAADVERGVGTVVQRVARLVVRLRDVAVELLMLPLADLLGLHHPERLQSDREARRRQKLWADLQSDFNNLQRWLANNKLLLNKNKTHIMIFGTRQRIKFTSNIHSLRISCLDNTLLQKVAHTKYLGLHLDSELSFKYHINHIAHKMNYNLSVLFRSRNCFPFKTLYIVLLLKPHLLLLPYLTIDSVGSYLTAHSQLIIAPCMNPLTCLHLILEDRFTGFTLFSNVYYFDYPSYLKQFLVPFSSTHLLRHTVQLFFFVPVVSKSIAKKSFMFKAPSDWNNLPINIRSISSFRLLGGLGIDVHTVGHHEGRVEAHSKLADDAAAGLRLVLQFIQESLPGATENKSGSD
ncbi:hypothetical protein N1851_009629 [Merluccius polli]|uniref:Uncharacterized protein n=1 Tax=Merluccius polli TaxID=89951 RepID=A0AA47P3Q2_MERPO|nr:hypothetical protein N1851_009629 [Merluccius polli]